MSRKSLLLLLAIAAPSYADINMSVGDGIIDGSRIKPYRLTWQQCSNQDGEWQNQGELTEELVVIGDEVLRHRQTAHQAGGVIGKSSTYFDRSSFAPLRMEMEADRDGDRLMYAERQLNAEGYTGVMIRGEDQMKLEGKISTNMLHGGVMGLPLATMDYQEEPVRFLASMIGFDGTYDVIANWADKDTLLFDGEKVEAWLIDVEWRHRESGDVYPPGPDASGGRYWVVPNPPNGYPYVPRYQTDTYAVEFTAGICPPTAQ